MIRPWCSCTISTSAGKAKSCCCRWTHWDKRKEAFHHVDSKRWPQQFLRTKNQLTSRTSRKLTTYKLRAALEEARVQSDRNEGQIVPTATGKTSAADISDSCLSKQKMLPHSGHQHTLWTSRTAEINEPPIHTISPSLKYCQQLQLCLFDTLSSRVGSTIDLT